LMQDPGALAAAFAPTARWGSIGRFHAAILPYFHPILEAHAQLNMCLYSFQSAVISLIQSTVRYARSWRRLIV
jgi:hypothetical protein